MDSFKAIVYAAEVDDAFTIMAKCLSGSSKYPQFQNYVSKLWLRKEEWCLAWRTSPCLRGHHTNNIAEASIRLYKDQVLQRSKAYNLVALVDFCVSDMEDYYKNRLLDFAHCRVAKPFLLYQHFVQKASYIKDSSEVVMLDDDTFKIPSESQTDCYYEVNSSNIYLS